MTSPTGNRLMALEYAEKIAYSSKDTLHFTYEMAKKYKDSEGIYVECGVAAGAQIIAMLAGAPGHQVWAFDSFEGIPLPSNKDDQMPGIAMLSKWQQSVLPDPGKQVLKSSGATVVSQEDFVAHVSYALNMTDLGNLQIEKGWFEVTVPYFALRFRPIAILRLDGDLYNSTFVCLQYLFPHVIRGCPVIIDDWQLPGCQAACKEYFALIGYEPEYQYISNIAYFIK